MVYLLIYCQFKISAKIEYMVYILFTCNKYKEGENRKFNSSYLYNTNLGGN